MIEADTPFTVPTQPVAWHREMNWEFGPDADDLWDTVLPGGGLILVDRPGQYDLPTGLETVVENAAVYGVSVTHQFHCIVSSIILTMILKYKTDLSVIIEHD